MTKFQSTVTKTMRTYPYTRMPDRLEKLYPELARLPEDDAFGLSERLSAVCTILGGRDLGTLIDLGGHSGFFAMSLIDVGMADAATVYDSNREALSAGRAAAEQMNIAKVEFIERLIDLDFLKSMPAVDTVLCLNLLHHAGTLFDADIVLREGWEKYAQAWLGELRQKSRVLVLSLGFKRMTKPPHWDVERPYRPLAFARLAEKVGWSTVYEANVRDIQALGVDRANRRFTTSRNLAMVRFHVQKLKEVTSRLVLGRSERKQHYHLYIFE
jgi:hypothetical protein